MQCTIVSDMFSKEEKSALLSNCSLVKTGIITKTLVGAGEDGETDHLKAFTLLQNKYSLLGHHEFLKSSFV